MEVERAMQLRCEVHLRIMSLDRMRKKPKGWLCSEVQKALHLKGMQRNQLRSEL